MDIVQILEKSISQDQNELKQAHELLNQFAQTNAPEYIKALAEVLANSEFAPYVRMAAGLQLKNQLTAKDEDTKGKLVSQWLSLPANIREEVKAKCFAALGTETIRPASASQCVAYIAAIELPHQLWPDLIKLLTSNATREDTSDSIKIASLETIGYICQEVKPELLVGESNQILTAIVNNMRKSDPALVLTSTTALFNSLEFTRANFDTENERHFIMQVICEATQSKEIKVQVSALQCLVKIMSLYYQYMEHYMGPALFAITMQAIKSEQPEIVLQGIEFWSNVCDEEIDLSFEASEAAEQGRPPSRTSKFYAKGALQFLVPSLLQILTQQDEDADEDEWNPCKAASVCLILLASCVENDIVNYVIPFITENIGKPDWHYREAAMMAFGSILEGPDPTVLVPIVEQALPAIIQLMHDESICVRDTTTWVLSKICEQVCEVVLKPDRLKPVLDVLIEALKAEPRVAVNACWAINSLSDAANDMAVNLEGNETPKTNCLSPYFQVLVDHLLACTDRQDAAMNNLRTSAYEALMELIKNSAQDCYSIVGSTLMILLDRLKRVLSLEADHHIQVDKNLLDIQSLLCGALQSVLRKMAPEDAPAISDAIMTATLQMLTFSAKTGNLNEDALLVSGTMCGILERKFISYYPFFKEYLFMGLKSYQNSSLASVSIGVVIDLCHALGSELLPFCDEIMSVLLEVLTNSATPQKIKSEVLSLFGDIALAIGEEVKKYLHVMLTTLTQASSVRVDRSNFEMVDYCNELWEATLQAYTGILQALKVEGGSGDQQANLMVLQDHIMFINQFIMRVAESHADIPDGVIAAASGLIGDLLSFFGALMLPVVEQPTVQAMLARGKRSRQNNTKTMATWAAREIKKVRAAHPQQPAQQTLMQAPFGNAQMQQQQATAESWKPRSLRVNDPLTTRERASAHLSQSSMVL